MFDWFTFFAQLINFLILIALLKHFLFHRIMNAMDQRQKRIAADLKEADDRKKAALMELEKHQEERRTFNAKCNQFLQQNKFEAEELKAKMVQEARLDIQASKRQWRESLEQQKKLFLDNLQKQTGKEIFDISNHVLKDLANENLENQIIHAFIGRLRDLDSPTQESIKEHMQGDAQDIYILSGFDVSTESRQQIEEAMNDCVGVHKKLKYEISNDIHCGIELRVNGHKVAWSLDDYLNTLKNRLNKVFSSEIKTKDMHNES